MPLSLKLCFIAALVAFAATGNAYPNKRAPSAGLEDRLYDEPELEFLDGDSEEFEDDRDRFFDKVQEMERAAQSQIFDRHIVFDRNGCTSTCEDGDRLTYCWDRKDERLKVKKEANSPRCCKREDRGRASCVRNQYGILEKSYCPHNYRGGERIFLGLPLYKSVISEKDCTKLNSAFYCLVEHLPNLAWNNIQCERNGKKAYCKRDRLPYNGSPNRPLVCFHPMQTRKKHG